MSLILEALRKSEAERRRGQSPDLHGASVGAPPPGREGFRQWPVVAGGALVLLAVALLLWPRAQPDAGDADAQAQAGAARDDGVSEEAIVASPPARRSPAAMPEGSRQAPRASVVQLPTQARPRPSPPAPAAKPPTSPARANIEPLPAPPALAGPPPDPPAATAPADDLPSLAALSAGERAALPPLKLSVHVWDSNPKQRFAIVDGQRIVEGGTIGAAVVDEIRRDGVVLEMNGRRVLLPKP